MFELSNKIRLVLFIIGGALVLLGILDNKGLLNNHPILNIIIFPYIWLLGVSLMFIGYGHTKENKKPRGSGGVDGAPGLGEKKGGLFGNNSHSGDGGGSPLMLIVMY